MKYPIVKNPKKVGSYPAQAKSGGGLFYDEILEYRVWVHPLKKDVYYQAFSNHEDALRFSETTENAEEPLVLIYQEEYINEPEPGKFAHVKEERITEWKPKWLEKSKGTKKQILQFLKRDK